MSRNVSMREMREQALVYLVEWEGRDATRYNVDGIIRDAWINGNGSDEVWRAAVEKNRYPFLVGDTVRVVVEIDGFEEYMYGTIESFRTADNRRYRRRILKPHSAYVDLFERSGVLRPLSEITPELDDFEIITDHAVVHKDGPVHNYGIFGCNSGRHGGFLGGPADVLVIHKRSGVQGRWCNKCNESDMRAQLGHTMWRQRQRHMETIRRLIANPLEITGPVGEWWPEEARGLADCHPYLVPEKAAELYAQWKEQQVVSAS